MPPIYIPPSAYLGVLVFGDARHVVDAHNVLDRVAQLGLLAQHILHDGCAGVQNKSISISCVVSVSTMHCVRGSTMCVQVGCSMRVGAGECATQQHRNGAMTANRSSRPAVNHEHGAQTTTSSA